MSRYRLFLIEKPWCVLDDAKDMNYAALGI